jgi:selenocysteine-specific elongation factor
MDMPEHIKNENYKQLQITLVDCPGHASLIRTIIGGKLKEKNNRI